VGADVLVSLLAYVVVYLIIYPSAVLIAARLVRKGPALAPETVAPIESGRPSAPINVELVQEGQDAMNALNFVPVWTLILGAGIFFYVLLDGFDLGVGMLYNFMPDTRSRNLAMNTRLRPYGTATRLGWCWAAWRCLRPFRLPSPFSSRRFIFRS
jgi:hypothetical protein